jgi:hypothetical protein
MATVTDTTSPTLADIVADMEGDVYSVEELVRAADIMIGRGQSHGLDEDECKALGRVIFDALGYAVKVRRAWDAAFPHVCAAHRAEYAAHRADRPARYQ